MLDDRKQINVLVKEINLQIDKKRSEGQKLFKDLYSFLKQSSRNFHLCLLWNPIRVVNRVVKN